MEAWRAELYHHGIKGQHWGVRRGPPYPLGKTQKRLSVGKSLMKTAGRIDNGDEKSHNSSRKGDVKLSKTVKIGAVAAVTALAAYGAYKSGYLSKASGIGESAVKAAIGKIGSMKTGDLGNFASSFGSNSGGQSTPKAKRKPVIRDPKTGFKIISEPLSESLKNANPLKGKVEGKNNCTSCSVAGILRTFGYDVVARSYGGKAQNLGGVVEDCFKGAKVYTGSAIKFAKSPEDAAEMLKKKFGSNASGVVGIDWRRGGGHAFSWIIKDGMVRFLDFQNNRDDDYVRSVFWPMMSLQGDLTFARLDGLEIDLANISKYVNTAK